MISQKCPKCFSSRVRRGYRPTPFWSKILFRYNLLCDNCNWEFAGFAVPGTVSAKPTRSPKKKTATKTSAVAKDQQTGAVDLKRDETAATAGFGQSGAEDNSPPEAATKNAAAGSNKSVRNSGV